MEDTKSIRFSKILATPEIKKLGKSVRVRKILKGVDSKSFFVESKTEQLILKIYKPGSEKEIIFTQSILSKLNTKYDNFLRPYGNFFYISNLPATLFYKIDAVSPTQKDINSNNLKKLAKLQANMHTQLRNFKPLGRKNRFSIFDFSFKDFFKYSCSKKINNLIENETSELINIFRKFEGNKFKKSIIHEDTTLDNLLIGSNGKMYLIDFDDAYYAEIISDLATTIKEIIIQHKGINKMLIKSYLKDYNIANPILDTEQLKLLAPLIRRRTLFMLVYLLHKKTVEKSDSYDDKIKKELETHKLIMSYKKTWKFI